MTIVHAPNKPDSVTLAAVVAEMRERGAPTIRAWWTGDFWLALEGSHRLAAAHALGVTPVIDPMDLGDTIDHDFCDLDGDTVEEVVVYLTSGELGPAYRFDGLERGR